MNDDETMDRLRVLFWIALLGWMIAMVMRFTLDSTGGSTG
jgi:cobalamin biosynthesis protein CobD/CbiB